MGAFLGFVELENNLPVTVLVKSTNTPTNTDALPTYRLYGPSGLMSNGTGTLAFKDTGTITNATNANPIAITCTGHGLTTGTLVTITGVLGNTNANGTYTITVVDANTFTLNGRTGNAGYTSGGVWNVAGLYSMTVPALSTNNYAAGQTYSLLISGAISTVAYADLHTFTVT